MQELITKIGEQNVRIVSDDSGIRVESFHGRDMDGYFVHSCNPIPVGKDRCGLDVYVGMAVNASRNLTLFLCDAEGRKLSECFILTLYLSDGTLEACSGINTKYAPVKWKFDDRKHLNIEKELVIR